MEEEIRKEFLSGFNDRIKEKESYLDFMSYYSKDQMVRLFKLNAVIQNNNTELGKSLLLMNKNKKHVIEELDKAKKKIYTNIIKSIDESLLQQLDYYLKSYKEKLYMINGKSLRVSLHFLEFLSINCIAKINYSKSKDKITIFTPEELRKTLEEILKDKKLKKICKENGTLKKNIHNLMSTYGVIPFKKLNKIYDKIYGTIKKDKLFDTIIINCVFDDEVKLISLEEEEYLVYGLGFEDEDDALTFFYSINEDLDYKIFKKKEYKEIGEGTYHKNFQEWYKLNSFLSINFDMSEEDLYLFDENFILDYIYSYQIDEELAKKNLSHKLDSCFEKLKNKDKKIIMNGILSIAKNYPSFYLKGHSINEIEK